MYMPGGNGEPTPPSYSLQLCPAIFAVHRIGIMAFSAACRASLGAERLEFIPIKSSAVRE
jgi:hypothetical protein